MKKYLVTGGAGFIGSWIAKNLLAKGYTVSIIDNLSTGYIENVPKGAQFIKGDCQDTQVYENLKNQRFDAIFHIAAQSSGEVSFDDPVYDICSNTESTLQLIHFGLSQGCERFLFASTMSVYGEKEDRPIAENEEMKPVSFYGVGKIVSENYLGISQKMGLKPTSLRLFNVYGPGQNLANLRQGIVSIYLAQMLKDNKIVVKGSLDRFRDFIYIKDVVDAFLLCLHNDETIGETFNVGTGIKTTVRQLIDLMMALNEKKVPVEMLGNTLGDVFGIFANVNHIEKITGFQPKYSLKNGLKKMLIWALEQEKKVQRKS